MCCINFFQNHYFVHPCNYANADLKYTYRNEMPTPIYFLYNIQVRYLPLTYSMLVNSEVNVYNVSGKSSLLRILAGLMQPNAGNIW